MGLPEKGEVILGKYRIVRQLGRGGMGVVLEAVNIATDGPVALKLLAPTQEDDDARRARMGREARAAAKLRSRFVGRVFDFDYTKDGSPVMVMELIEGHDLSVEIRRTGLLRIEDAVSYVIQACAGVGEAHDRGVIHRDLKPGNLFLDLSNPTSPMVRVLDFGLSKIVDSNTSADLTSPTDALGTPSYMSPEQMRATKDVGAQTDVWALGIILYRVLTGNPPIDVKGVDFVRRLIDSEPLPRVVREGVSAELAGVIARALDKNAARRYADARALGHALIPFVAAPSPTTKLAIDELATKPSTRDLAPLLVAPEEVEESTTQTAMVTEDTETGADPPDLADVVTTRQHKPVRNVVPPAGGLSRPPPPSTSERASFARPRRRLPRWWRRLSRESRYLVGATAALSFASLFLALTLSPRKSEPRTAVEPEIVAIPVPLTSPVPAPAPPRATSSMLPAPLPVVAPAASVVAPTPRAAPRPKTLPPILKRESREDDNPSRL